MNGKFVLASSLETIEKRFTVRVPGRLEWVPQVVVSRGDETLVITQQEPRELALMRFGYTPAGVKEPWDLLHARAEGGKNRRNDPLYSGSPAIFMKSAFKKPLFRQRCVVIADAFVVWPAAGKQPWLVYLKDRERPFGMAGVYDVWIHPVTKAEIRGFALISVPGNDLIHRLPAARMPVIIPRGRELPWLRSSSHLSDILGMLSIFPAEKMNAYPLSPGFDQNPPLAGNSLKPAGERIYSETERKILPVRHWGHKQKGAGASTWRGEGS
jgi:putative SOS response-associated peptidase YedK